MRLSVLVPAYNEAESLPVLIKEIATSLDDLSGYEILVIDDGSSDASVQVCHQLQTDYPALRVIRHLQNAGQSAAICTGLDHAQGELICTMDADGQNNPADIPTLLGLYDQHSATAKVAILGNREKRRDSFLRKLSSRVANHLRKRLLSDNCLDTGCSLKIMARDDLLKLPRFDHMHRYFPALLMRQGVQLINHPVSHRPRVAGVSKYGVGNRLWVGVIDILGVRWLQRRPVRVAAEESKA